MADDKRKLADPKKTYWTIADVAAHWGVKPTTIHTYRTRGWLPPEDETIGNAPVWKPKTITSFKRPGRGARTDLRDSST
ncbi:MarR family transcriptional regulator [Actinomadura sp. KC216]|uniref:MerR family transcriptional regulator n=1 Tax=Actinomadura sp. KC216 TaxID=2530370 RepID=UPI001050017E|nr:MarR family transcriptional regulator [Actinomadura sp. KC216]TDB88329.1 MarR family transcriptional regulator [Actinomadura sp. KC216]